MLIIIKPTNFFGTVCEIPHNSGEISKSMIDAEDNCQGAYIQAGMDKSVHLSRRPLSRLEWVNLCCTRLLFYLWQVARGGIPASPN